MQMLVLEENQTDRYSKIVELLNRRHAAIKAANPQGFRDEFESSIDTICTEIARSLGGGYTYRDGKQHVLVFYFPPMSAVGVEQHLDRNPNLWK